MTDVRALFHVETVTLDAGGYGVVTGIGPDFQGSQWNVTRITTHVESDEQFGQPTEFRVYRGPVSATTLLEGTYSGDFDTSDSHFQLQHGERFSVEWRYGPAGKTAVCRIEGTYSQPGRFVR